MCARERKEIFFYKNVRDKICKDIHPSVYIPRGIARFLVLLDAILQIFLYLSSQISNEFPTRKSVPAVTVNGNGRYNVIARTGL